MIELLLRTFEEEFAFKLPSVEEYKRKKTF